MLFGGSGWTEKKVGLEFGDEREYRLSLPGVVGGAAVFTGCVLTVDFSGHYYFTGSHTLATTHSFGSQFIQHR